MELILTRCGAALDMHSSAVLRAMLSVIHEMDVDVECDLPFRGDYITTNLALELLPTQLTGYHNCMAIGCADVPAFSPGEMFSSSAISCVLHGVGC